MLAWTATFGPRASSAIRMTCSHFRTNSRRPSPAKSAVQLSPAEQLRLTQPPSVDPQAYDAYLRGRYFFNRPSDENLQKEIAQFEEAARLSPNFAPAYSGLSDAYNWAG